MATIQEIRKQYPQYSDMSDQQLADALHRKFYSDMPRDEFNKKIGLSSKPAQKPKRSLSQEFTGAMANINRGLGIADELQGAFMTVEDAVRGNIKGRNPLEVLGSVGQNFRENMGVIRGQEDDFAARRPIAANMLRSTGAGATVFVPGGAGTQALRAPNALMGAVKGAVAAAAPAAAYGFADRGTFEERLGAAKNAMAFAAPLGAVGGALASRGQRPPTGTAPQRPPRPQQVLEEAGVSLTPGQRLGGVAKSAEDLGARAPILGTAIRGARQRGAESLNRAVALRALEPIGEGIPKNVKTGHESVAYVAERLGKVYDDAAALVPMVEPDEQFGRSLSAIQMNVSELGPDIQQQFATILQNRLFGRAQGRPLSGPEWRAVESDIGRLASTFGASDDGAQRALGEALEEVVMQMRGQLGRINPEAGAMISRANQGWTIYTRLRSAASKAAKGGVFAPGQLSTAVRTMDRSVGKGNVAKGQAVLQDLSSAASEVMPDAFGNPGTADAIGVLTLGGAMVNAPAQAIPAAVGLSAAATPYFLMGRRIVEQLPANATTSQLNAAQRQLAQLAAQDPAVQALLAQVQARAARAAGVAGGVAASEPRNALAPPQ
jgi:hypothetical protein